jgi:hypothetical protein
MADEWKTLDFRQKRSGLYTEEARGEDLAKEYKTPVARVLAVPTVGWETLIVTCHR